MGTAINSIPTPEFGTLGLLHVLYILIAACFAMLSVFFKKSGASRPYLKSLLVSFVLAWGAFAVRMDYNWQSLFADELRLLSGKGLAEKIALVDGMDMYSFVGFAKEKMPQGEMLREVWDLDLVTRINTKRPGVSQEDIARYQISRLAMYYSLPVLTSREGRFVLVYNDPGVGYDPVSRTLRMGDKTLKAAPYAVYGDRAALFELAEEGR